VLSQGKQRSSRKQTYNKKCHGVDESIDKNEDQNKLDCFVMPDCSYRTTSESVDRVPRDSRRSYARFHEVSRQTADYSYNGSYISQHSKLPPICRPIT
jgi:hypothetical protein